MLFSIYIASLIVLSNVMALQSPGSDSPSGVLCNLIVYVGASAKGWVSKKGIQLTTDPDFSKAQTFKLVGSPNTQLPTVYIIHISLSPSPRIYVFVRIC
jgi:hypothetical protein